VTPEDWEQGIVNEAASVEDSAWVRETQLTALRAGLMHALGLAVAVLGGIAALQIAVLMLLGPNKPLHLLWIMMMCAVASAGLRLSRVGVSVWHIGLGALLYLPLTWAFVVMTQWLWADFAPQTPQLVTESCAVLPVLAMNVAGVLAFWRRRKEKVA